MIKNTHIFLLIILVFVALGLRLYDINNAFGYYGDQGRDLIEVYKWLKTGNIPLFGSSTSISNFHLGPIYYYLIAPFLIIFKFHPIGAVYFNLFSGILLIISSFFLINKFVDRYTALIFSSLVVFSPMVIFLSRGSWNSNPQPLATILLIFSVIQFIRSNNLLFIFTTGTLLGIGIQLHYTFLLNLLSIICVLFIFRTKVLFQYKTWTLFLLGFVIPLSPFLLGQIQNNFSDMNSLQAYLSKIKYGETSVFFQPLIDRLYFPFDVFFPTENLPWFSRFITIPLWLLILLSTIIISFSKTKLSSFSIVVVIFFLTGSIQAMIIRVNFYNHYYLNLGIMAVLLISIYISYLYQYAHLKFIWLLPLGLFVWWEIYFLPNYLGTKRNPQIVLETAKFIVNKIKSSKPDPAIGIFVISPVTLREGFEYRYLLEKEGLNTFSSSRVETADYLIIEKSNSESVNYQSVDITNEVLKISDLKFDAKIGIIKFVEIYKIQRN